MIFKKQKLFKEGLKKSVEAAEEYNKTKEEVKLEIAKSRMKCIERLTMRGAETVKEYLSLKKEIEWLEEEKSYSQWFKENYMQIEGFFDVLFNEFVNSNNRYVKAVFNKLDNVLEYEGYKVNYNFMLKLLKRYGYIVEVERSHTVKLDVKISYERREF